MIGAAVLALLAVDGVVNSLVAVLMLPSYLGFVWFPLSAAITGLVNTALVWAAMQWTSSDRMAALPLILWFLTVGVLVIGGPGADVMFSGIGSAILLMVCGGLPPAWLLSRRGGHQHRPTAEAMHR